VKVGQPLVKGAEVTARIVEQDRSKKVMVYKVKKRKKYRKTIGHRQAYTRIEITGIQPSA
jgi:large subunit ribosomal protein L21